MIGLVLLKLWLVDFVLIVAEDAALDNLLFTQQAASILDGRWLGRYSDTALVKGPGYPLFVAGVNLLGIPLRLAQHLLYAASCALVVLSLAPHLGRTAWQVLAFGFLLFNPYTYAYETVIRFGVYPALALLVFASAFGVIARFESRDGHPWGWSALLGLALAALWYTREEGVWIVPSLALLLVVAGAIGWWRRRPLARTLVCLLLPLGIWAAVTVTLASVNRVHYGAAITNELKTREFQSAYGGLLRVAGSDARRFYPVPRAARERAYEASAAFRELRPIIEGPRGRVWMDEGDDDYAFSIFLFALRNATAQAGYYRDASTAMGFYERMGNELEAACRSERVACSPKSRIFPMLVPPWQDEHRAVAVPIFATTLIRLASFAEPPISEMSLRAAIYLPMGSPGAAIRALYESVTNSRIAPATPEMMRVRPAFERRRAEFKVGILERVHDAYRLSMPIAVVGALLLFLWSCAVLGRRGWAAPLVVMPLSVLIGVVSSAVILTLMQVFTHPGIWRPMQHGFALVLLFVVSAGALARHALVARRQ
jgi:hypothetical protein